MYIFIAEKPIAFFELQSDIVVELNGLKADFDQVEMWWLLSRPFVSEGKKRFEVGISACSAPVWLSAVISRLIQKERRDDCFFFVFFCYSAFFFSAHFIQANEDAERPLNSSQTMPKTKRTITSSCPGILFTPVSLSLWMLQTAIECLYSIRHISHIHSEVHSLFVFLSASTRLYSVYLITHKASHARS